MKPFARLALAVQALADALRSLNERAATKRDKVHYTRQAIVKIPVVRPDRCRKAKPMEAATPAQQKLIDDHLEWIGRVAGGWARRRGLSHEFDMLHNAALLGLEQAARRFDPKINARFKTVCLWRVTGEMGDACRRSDDMSRVARKQHRDSGMPAVVTSIDALDATEQRRLKAVIPAKAEINQHELNREVVEALSMVPVGKSRDVVKAYYLEGLKMHEIGKRMGLSESRICQIHDKAISEARRVARLEANA